MKLSDIMDQKYCVVREKEGEPGLFLSFLGDDENPHPQFGGRENAMVFSRVPYNGRDVSGLFHANIAIGYVLMDEPLLPGEIIGVVTA